MADHRAETSLDGAWRFRTDPGDAGRDAGWQAPGADWPDSTDVAVPAAWQSEGFRDYAGVAWYRRTVEREAPPEGRAFLRFGAVDYRGTVWLNGQRVGDHRGGYLPFEVEVTDVLRAGENSLVVRVEDPADTAEIPHGKQGDDWYTPVSGIWQSVELHERPETFVDGIRVTPDLAEEAADVAVTVDGPTPDGHEARVVVSRAGETVASTTVDVDADGAAAARLDVPDPDPWSPADPALYDVVVELRRDGAVVDRHADRFGMRSVAVEDGELLLNGDPLFLRGALDQGYYPGTLYRPFEEGLFEREIRQAKAMGFNLLRKHLKPAHPEFLDAADELGILVWEEPANPDRDTERSRRAVREQLHGMVDRDYNHPSVVAWSLYNEEWGIGGADDEESLWESDDRQDYLADLYREVRAADPTRPVCDNSGWAHVATDINDYHEYIVAPERSEVWADRLDEIETDPGANYGRAETDPAGAARIVSEFGTWGIPDLGDRAGPDDRAWAPRAVEGRGEFADADGADGRFETHLADVFEDYADLAATWQAREAASNRTAVEAMRARGLGGYVLTEFSDIEWEFNGVLDYGREPKAQTEFVAANGPLMVTALPDRHAVRAGEPVGCALVVSNHTADPVEAAVEWAAFGERGTVAVDIPAFGTARIPDAFAVTPPGGETTRGAVSVSLDCAAGTASADQPVVGVGAGANREAAAVYAPTFGDRLASAGYTVVDDPGVAEVALLTGLGDARPAVEDGLDAVLVPGPDGRFLAPDPFAVRELSTGVSWHLAAGLLYHDDPLLAPLAGGKTPGRAFAGLGPYDLLECADGDRVRVGYVEGWLANHAGALVAREVGAGTVTACAFRAGSAYGDHPAATYLLDGLLAGL